MSVVHAAFLCCSLIALTAAIAPSNSNLNRRQQAAAAPRPGALIRSDSSVLRSVEIGDQGQAVSSGNDDSEDGAVSVAEDSDAKDAVDRDETSADDEDDAATDDEGAPAASAKKSEANKTSVNATANATATGTAEAAEGSVTDDTALCKDVKGIKVKDSREKGHSVMARITQRRNGEGKDCGTELQSLGSTDGLQTCAATVARTLTCSNTFQLHRSDYTCSCVPNWSGATCHERANKDMCLYELNPGTHEVKDAENKDDQGDLLEAMAAGLDDTEDSSEESSDDSRGVE